MDAVFLGHVLFTLHALPVSTTIMGLAYNFIIIIDIIRSKVWCSGWLYIVTIVFMHGDFSLFPDIIGLAYNFFESIGRISFVGIMKLLKFSSLSKVIDSWKI